MTINRRRKGFPHWIGIQDADPAPPRFKREGTYELGIRTHEGVELPSATGVCRFRPLVRAFW
jgi:hypothetical protein